MVKQKAPKINRDEILGLLTVYLEPHRMYKILEEWIQNFKANTQLVREWLQLIFLFLSSYFNCIFYFNFFNTIFPIF